eukprot:747244-Hanusia_phi.AAC.1
MAFTEHVTSPISDGRTVGTNSGTGPPEYRRYADGTTIRNQCPGRALVRSDRDRVMIGSSL